MKSLTIRFKLKTTKFFADNSDYDHRYMLWHSAIIIRCLCCGGDQEYVLSQGWEHTVERRVCGGTSILDTRPPQSPSIHPGQVVSPLHYDALHVHIYQNHLATFCDLDALLGWVDIKLCHWFQKFLFSLI